MNLRSEWKSENEALSDIYFDKTITIQNVIDNFDFRRNYSAEGYSVTVDGVTVQVIIQNHSNPIHQSDVDKKILLPIDAVVNTGSYIVFRGQTWIINSNVTIIDDAYKLCQMQLCNYTLKFQSPSGTILSYPCIDESSNTVGINESTQINTLSSVKRIKLPFDDNTKLIKVDDRFFVSKGGTATFAITNVNDTEFNYGDKGLIVLTMKASALQTSDGEKPKDRPDLGICNYFDPIVTPEPPDPEIPTEIVTITSDATDNQVILGITHTFSATFKDELGVDVPNVIAQYSVDNTYSGKVKLVDNGNGTATVTVGNFDDNQLCNKQFTLRCYDARHGFESTVLLTIVGIY